jgi:Histidine kinase-, DNA gyrase B-, and HSP90-like ATPase
VKGLAPLNIDEQGLQFALAELAKETALTHGIVCRLECPHPVAPHDNFTANELYMIAREAVHNAVKHGRPRSIVIRLESSQGLLLQIRDDGVGIARARERAQEGFGLRIMRYRSQLIGATLKVVRRPNGGTVVTCTRTRPDQGGGLVATTAVADANGLTAETTRHNRGRRATELAGHNAAGQLAERTSSAIDSETMWLLSTRNRGKELRSAVRASGGLEHESKGRFRQR